MTESIPKQRTSAKPSDPPPGWGSDKLTEFLDEARRNQWATYANKRAWVHKLIAIDAQLAAASEGWLNPKSEIAALLLLRCHGAFRAACGLAMAGQAAETYVVCRQMLEFAAYALHIDRNPQLGAVWINRHSDAASLKAQKEAFLHRKVLDSVRAANVHAAERFETLYQRAIDWGAHPNELSVTGNLEVVEDEGVKKFSAILLHRDGIELDQALRSVAQCGMISLELLQQVFNARFELLGINAAMLALRKGL